MHYQCGESWDFLNDADFVCVLILIHLVREDIAHSQNSELQYECAVRHMSSGYA